MQQAPKSRANELLDEIMLFINSGSMPSEFERVKLNRDIERLNIPLAKDTLVMLLTCADGDFETAEQLFNQAFDTYGYDSFIVRNYIYALGKIGRHIKQLEVIHKYAELTQSPNLLVHALGVSVQYCDLTKVKKYLDLLGPMESGLKDSKSEISEAKSMLKHFDEFFKNHKIDKSYVSEVIHLVLQELENSSMNFITTKYSARDEGFLDICFGLDSPLDNIVALNDQLVDSLIVSDLYSSNVVVRFERDLKKV